MNRFYVRRLVTVLYATGMLGVSAQAMASAFQLWEQDGSSVGSYHAGYAALANDASIAWYNPAGITRIKNPQAVLGAAVIASDIQYKGNISVTETIPLTTRPSALNATVTKTYPGVTGQAGTFNVVPNFHYVQPITDRIGLGLSIDAPFGLKTNYGTSTPARYSATLSSLTVVDLSPSIGFQVTKEASLGAGFDIQRAYAEFDSNGVLLTLNPLTHAVIETPGSNTPSRNKAQGTGYGFHIGGMYQFTPDARIGLSYHSQVVQHLSGSSVFVGYIPDHLPPLPFGSVTSSHASSKITLPPYTALSGFYKVNPLVAVMGSIIYTQWNTFKTLTLNSVTSATPIPTWPFAEMSSSVNVTIPEHYHNTWNLSIGSEYYPTDRITLRVGLGYDQSPVQNAYRNLQLPDNDRYAVALGGGYKVKSFNFDLGWTHIFFKQATVNPPAQVVGAETINVNGSASGAADVVGAQVTWNFC